MNQLPATSNGIPMNIGVGRSRNSDSSTIAGYNLLDPYTPHVGPSVITASLSQVDMLPDLKKGNYVAEKKGSLCQRRPVYLQDPVK